VQERRDEPNQIDGPQKRVHRQVVARKRAFGRIEAEWSELIGVIGEILISHTRKVEWMGIEGIVGSVIATALSIDWHKF
jgi:hypothetical protein